MQKHKPQQFAKFFLKDLKAKTPKYEGEQSDIHDFIYSPNT